MTSFLLRAHLRKRLKCSGKMSDFVWLFLVVQQNLGVLFTRHWENPSMPILKDHLEIESTFALGIFAWKVFDHMALRLSLKRQNESFGNVFWKGFGIYGICGLLHTFYDDHWGPTRNRFPNTFLERYHIRDTKIWKISITTWTLSWRHPFKTVAKEPSKSCRNLSNRNIHDSTSKVIPVIHVSLLENGDCQPTLGNTWGYTS